MFAYCFIRCPNRLIYGAANALSPVFNSPLNLSMIPSKGNLTNFSRASGIQTITDHEGIVVDCENNEARFKGLRREQNIARPLWSTEWAVFNNHTAVYDYETDELTITHDTAYGLLAFSDDNSLIDEGGEVLCSMDIQFISGKSSINNFVMYTGGTGTVSITTLIDSKPEGEWFTIGLDTVGVGLAAGNYTGFYCFSDKAVPIVYKIRNLQYVKVDGRTNPVPPDYVPVGRPDGPELMADSLFADPANWSNVGGKSNDAGGRVGRVSQGKIEVVCDGILFGGLTSVNAYFWYMDGVYDGIVTDAEYIFSFKIENYSSTGTTSANVGCYTGYGDIDPDNVVINGDGWYATKLIGEAADLSQTNIYPSVAANILNSTSSVSFDITEIRISVIEKDSNVDGVEYFDTTNGNSVVNNELIPAAGTDIDLTGEHGFLSEIADDNLCLRSEDLDLLTANKVTPTRDTVNKIGGRDSWGLVATDTTDTDHHVAHYTSSISTEYVHQFVASAADEDYAYFQYVAVGASGLNNITVIFNLINGTVDFADKLGTGSQTLYYTDIQPVKGGWLCTVCLLTDSDHSIFNIDVIGGTNAAVDEASTQFVSTVGSTIIRLGMIDVKAATEATSYIPTDGSIASRQEDIAEYVVPSFMVDAANPISVFVLDFYLPANAGANGRDRFFLSIKDSVSNFKLRYTASTGVFSILSSLVDVDGLSAISEGWHRAVVQVSDTAGLNEGEGTRVFIDGGATEYLKDSQILLPNMQSNLFPAMHIAGNNIGISIIKQPCAPVTNVKIYNPKEALTDSELSSLSSGFESPQAVVNSGLLFDNSGI